MAFDIQGAKKEGYSDREIADYLASQKKFDLKGARKEGYSDEEIIKHLADPEQKKKETYTGPTTFEAKVAPQEPSIVDRVSSALKELVSGPGSVMDKAPTGKPAPDRRLELGQGPISQETLRKAQDIREGVAKPQDQSAVVQRTAEALEAKKAPTVRGLVDRAMEEERLAEKVRKTEPRSFIGASAESGGRAVLAAGARILDELNPFTLSESDAATLFKNDPEALKYFTGKSATMVLSRFANEQTARAAEVMQQVSPDERGVVSGRSLSKLEYATLSPDKAAYLSPTRIAGDVLNSLPTTLALAVTGYLTRGRALQAASEAEASALASGATAEAAKTAARNASIKAGAETMAKVGAVSEGAAGYGIQRNQTFQEAMAVPQDVLEKSPYYKDLIKQGYSPEAARLKLATAASQESGVVGGAVDAATNLALGGVLGKVIGEGGKLLPRFGKGFAGEAVTETIQSAGEQAGANLAMQQVDPRREALAGVGEAAAAGLVVGGITGGGTAAVFGTKPVTPEQQLARELQASVDNAQPTGVNEAAIRALNPQTYDQTLVSPQQTVNRSAQIDALSQATSVDEAVTAAADLAGTVDGARSYAPSQAPTAAAPLAGTTPTFGGLPIAPAVGGVTPQADRVTPEITPLTETQEVTLPEPDVAVEQQFGLDKLRQAPRPQRIQGQAVADLSDDDLRAVVENDSAPAITRRGAQIELDARAKETAPPAAVTQAAAPVTTEVSRETANNFIDIPADASTAALPDADSEPVGGVAAADRARAVAQTNVDRWAAASNETAPVLNPAPAEEDAAVNQIANALNSQFGGRVYAFHDSDPNSVNGFALGGTAFVNTASPQINVGKTSLHEFKHTVEQIAEAERRQGLTDTPAQQFTASIDGIFSDMTEEGKRAYSENFLHKAELDAIADPAAREERLQQLLQEPLLVSEMTADFLGNRATDKAFWRDVAKADPQGFKGFVDKWIGIIDNLLTSLRGPAAQKKGESAKIDQYVRDLKKAKMVARDALIAYRQGTLQQTQAEAGTPAMSLREGEGREANIPGRGEGVQPSPERAGPAAGEDGRSDLPSYGEAREGAISVVGRHYSPRVQTSLNSAYYGTGLRGAEGTRLRESKDSRISNRIYFYVDTGNGIRPENGVGRFAHEVQLNNIYDPATRLIPPQGSSNAFESAVIDAGFDGYIAPFGRGAAVVMLGPKHDAVPVQSLEAPAFAKKQKAAPARVMFEVAPDPNNAELKTRWDEVPFERKIEISQRVAEKIMPQVFKLAGVRAKMTTQLGGYLDDTSPSFAALVPDTASAEQLMDVARLGGFGLAQDSMMVLDLKAFEGSSPTGLITVVLPENMVDQESVHAIYRALRAVSPENISGHTTVGTEMVLAVPSDMMDDLASKIEGVLNGRPENFTLKTAEGHMAFPTKEEYDYGQAGKGSPKLFAKRAEANRIREEASAAIEEELAKDESAGGRQIDTGIYRSIADDFGLSQAEYNASALPLMLGKTGSNTFRAPKIGGIPEVVEWLDKRYRDAGMASLDLNKAEDRTTLAKIMAAEAVGAIRSAGTAVEWYDDTIRKTLQIMAVKYPELNTDANARNAFLIAIAISSQTMNVENNLRYASKQYEAYRASVNAQGVGKFLEVGTGKSAPAMGKNFALANSLLDEMGPDLLRRFLQTEFTKRELESIGFKISSESMDEKMLGSAVFGPKIGFGFYSNLSGNFEPVTMDMWFMRTVGRLIGRLPAFDEELFDKQVANLRSAIAETGDSSKGLFAANFDKALVDEAMKSDDGAIALARAVNSLHNRQFIKERAKFDSKERYKTNLVGAAGTILKSADKPKDSPGGGGERQRLRDVVRQMVALVEQQIGKRVPPAALQALIWYPEQELYKKLGVKLQVTSQDYAGAAKLLLTKEGFDGKRINAAAESGSGPARQMAERKVAGADTEAGAKNEKLGPLKGEERTAFVGPRVTQRLKQQANAKPLADVFAGLEKRGLPKTNMEKLINLRDDAARITYVQENFIDILSELEDSGKVKINCD